MARSLTELDRAATARINAYYRELDEGEDTILSEEDALAASMQADGIYMEHTDLPATECSDRALDIAFKVKDIYMERIRNPQLAKENY